MPKPPVSRKAFPHSEICIDLNKIKKSAPDHGPSERWQHTGRLLEPSERAGVLTARVLETDVLDRLVLARVIADRHRQAALRLRADFQAAGLSAHLVSGYSSVRTEFSFYGGWDERSEKEEKAYARWRRAVSAMGQVFSGTVLSVVCYDEALPSAKHVLLLAGLAKLTKWYGQNPHPSDEDIDQTATGERAARRGSRGVGGKLLH